MHPDDFPGFGPGGRGRRGGGRAQRGMRREMGDQMRANWRQWRDDMMAGGAEPPMPPMPPGAMWGGRGRGRGPGRGRRGDVRNAILALLAQEPSNGYQLIAAISHKTEGLWAPGPGSIYPALSLLADEGLIEQQHTDAGSKVYALTDAGRTYVEEHAQELDEPWAKVADPHRGYLDVRAEVAQLAMALKQVVMAGDEAQVTAAKDVLDHARRELYKILAEDPGER